MLMSIFLIIVIRNRVKVFASNYLATSVVINSFSPGEASIFTPTCWFHATISHSPILAETRSCFSASESQNVFSSASIDEVDCLKRNCNDAFETIGFPYSLLRKSSTSCVIVVTQRPNFLALLISWNKKFAATFDCIIIQASSITRSLGFLCALTFVQI